MIIVDTDLKLIYGIKNDQHIKSLPNQNFSALVMIGRAKSPKLYDSGNLETPNKIFLVL